MASSLLDATALSFVYVRSSAGQTVEIVDPAGAAGGACDDAGTVTGPTGEVVLRTPFGWMPVAGRARALGTDAYVAVTRPDAGGLGWARVTRYSATPRSQKATLALLDAGGATVGAVEPGNDDAVAIAAGDGTPLASLTLVDRDRGLRRSTMTYAYSPEASLQGDLRALVLAAALRYRKLLTEALAQATHES